MGNVSKLPVVDFKRVEDLSQFTVDFIKNYNENSNKGYFLELDVKHPKKLFNHHKDLPPIPERKKIGKCKKLACTV